MALYLGLKDGKRELFRSSYVPTSESHGMRFDCVIGPFRTVGGAMFMRDYGSGNPHCRCVADAERLSRKYSEIDA
jgi:hypothetical protein